MKGKILGTLIAIAIGTVLLNYTKYNCKLNSFCTSLEVVSLVMPLFLFVAYIEAKEYKEKKLKKIKKKGRK